MPTPDPGGRHLQPAATRPQLDVDAHLAAEDVAVGGEGAVLVRHLDGGARGPGRGHLGQTPAGRGARRRVPLASPAMDPTPFGARLAAAVAGPGPLCAGIDPHPALLRAWGLDDGPAGLERFALAALEGFAGAVAAVKPQAAFFERHGSRGVAVLERVVAAARDAGVLCVVDAKRGDIGSTMEAYAQAYAGDGSPLAGDAVTATAFLGFGALDPLLDLAEATGRGVFVLALTSNPEGAAVQHALVPGSARSVAGDVAAGAAARNAAALAAAPGGSPGAGPGAGLGPVGLVVGATVGDAPRRLGLDLAAVRGPLLAPGLGAQGAAPADLPAVFGEAACRAGAVLPAVSRELLAAGPDRAALRDAARRTADACRTALA